MPTIATGRTAQAPPDGAAPRARRLPSLSTLIFIGFLVFTAARFLNSSGFGDSDPTTAPAPGGVGIVTFGQGLTDDCDLTQKADRFQPGAEIWWRADLTTRQPGELAVVVRAYRDEGQIDRYEIPAEPELDTWSVLCAGEPVPGYSPGAYRVEIWDGAEAQLLAVGEYTKIQ